MTVENKTEMNIGKSLQIAMVDAEISCAKLAEDLGVSLATISSYRSQKTQSGKVIDTLANYFGMTSSEFVALGEQ